MIPLTIIREKPEEIVELLKIKNFDAAELIRSIIQTDEENRKLKGELDSINNQSNQYAKQIGECFKKGEQTKAAELKELTKQLKESEKTVSERLAEVGEIINAQLVQLPNIPHPSVKPGRTAEDNEIIFTEGEIPQLSSDAKPHWDLASEYKLIDFELGVKITGSGFPVYTGKGARLQRALINFFLDEAIKAGYMEIQPPLLVNEASGFGTGQIPDKEGQMYHATADNLYLIPTAEVPVTNLYRDVIIKPEQLPIRNAAYSSCFRREAGSYGKDVRGLNRLHQFDKVEIVQISHPDKSYDVLNEMVEHVKSLLRKLELPFRVLRLCGGDTSFASALTFDFEVYSAAQQRWLEVSSVSNFETFQSNRMKLRIKEEKKTILAHTLNGSALALPRIVASLLENNQTAEGIKIPKALVDYTGFSAITLP
ncbi:MAG: serine--tRNA ligase [Bacteroidota bacterium]